MAFTRKSFYLVSIFSGIVIILGFLSFYGLNKPTSMEAPRVREFHVENEASTAPPVSQHTNSSGTVLTSSPVPRVSLDNESQASIIVTPTDEGSQNSIGTDSTSVNHGEQSPVKPTGHRDIVQIPNRAHAFPQFSEVDSSSANSVLPSAPQPSVTVESAPRGQGSVNTITSVDTATPEPWSEPDLKKVTTTVSFPRTKTYKLGETFVVTLAVIKGVNPTVTIEASRLLGIEGNTTTTQTPLMTVSREMKAILMYSGKKVDSGDTEIQRVSSKQATIWSWDVTPDSPGRHYMKIILTAQVPNNKPDFSRPFIYELTVTEDLWSHIQRVLGTWITPQWISADWLWKSILLPVGLFVLWQVRARWRAHRRKKKLAQKNEQTSR